MSETRINSAFKTTTTLDFPAFIAWKLAVAIGIGLRLGWEMPEIATAIIGALR